jgi:osmoprotectant transport system permease protein
MSFVTYFIDHAGAILQATWTHLGLTLASLALAALVAIPLGLWLVWRPKLAGLVLGLAGLLQTIPSIALLGALIPLLGIGVVPAILALVLYAILPILRNTYTGIQEVDPAVTEAARGMGMHARQVLWRVQLPLALPVLLAGVRTAAVINVGVATLAAYIGAGGLGDYIFKGISLNNANMILAGAVPAALLALAFDQFLGWLPRIGRRQWLGIGVLFVVGIGAGWLSRSPASATADSPPVLRAAFDPEFADRADWLPSVRDKYPGIPIGDFQILNAGFLYQAVAAGEVDLISGYSTDGRVQAYDLFVLEDDRQAFPPYECAAVLHGATLRRYPELRPILARLDGRLSDSLMTALNYRVDEAGATPAAVADSFLRQQQLLPASPAPPRRGEPPLRIGSKLFTEQYILAEIFRQLIVQYTGLPVELKTGLGGTQICYEALKKGEIDLYPEYSGTGFQVILQPPDSLRTQLFPQPARLFTYVREHCREQDDVHWLNPLGFNNTYALMVRREAAQNAGWQRISDLLTARPTPAAAGQ